MTFPSSHSTTDCKSPSLRHWGDREEAQALRSHDLEQVMLATSETFSSLIYKSRH